ncbi:MAG: hypothetical protein U9Q78_04205 [Chloroflexota bacterium]|nr:hypothetical protein [Chloroflexota bacterium]
MSIKPLFSRQSRKTQSIRKERIKMRAIASKFGRALMVLAMMLSFSLVAAVPAAGQTSGTISLDADWYKTGDTVTVTIEDADLDVLESESPEESSTTPDGAVTVFQ